MNQPSNGGHPSTPDLTPSTASKVLATAECRTVVQYLIAKETDTTDFDELVDFVHEEIDTITTSEQARIGLIHIHLPKLADYDVIEYDGRSAPIYYRDHLQLEAMLDLTRQIEGGD
ncbi:DUF7344 domain-containing protein [Haladaptatus halobius]|uniref:DUF7344 domain-containing protein n=1 Tax=Haladaptatus halobius TaxID=2884875 RepID=UPI001D0BA0EF|nr:hypothetical protein [Haladaptatus halobius]